MDYGSKRKAVEAAESAGFHVDLVTGAVHTTSESDRATDYRGFKIERDSGRGGYLLHYPEGEGNPKSVKTLKAAKAYIDTYMGDSGTEGLSGGVGKAPPSPPSGFGKEKTREDYRKRIDWEGWAAAKAREDGHEAVAQGHDMARAAYITNYGLKVDGGLRGLDGVSKGTRQGTRVRFNANPGSLVLYSHHPEIGEEGTVGTMPGFGKRTYLPGPGGGLLYVDWDQSGMIGVSPNDVERVKKGRGTAGLSEYEGEMKSMSYGDMPPKAEFVTRTEGQYPYPMELVGADQELVQDLLNDEGIEEFDSKYRNKLGVRVIDAKAMYRFLSGLKERYEDGNDAAGDLASSILGTLGYEWI
jgi:hypothetical protein